MEESLWSGWNALLGAPEAGGPRFAVCACARCYVHVPCYCCLSARGEVEHVNALDQTSDPGRRLQVANVGLRALVGGYSLQGGVVGGGCSGWG